jgi:hypothetical protein
MMLVQTICTNNMYKQYVQNNNKDPQLLTKKYWLKTEQSVVRVISNV